MVPSYKGTNGTHMTALRARTRLRMPKPKNRWAKPPVPDSKILRKQAMKTGFSVFPLLDPILKDTHSKVLLTHT
jgi:hypothetical protein